MFVAQDGEYGTLNDEDDPDLPSRAEILETSRRIFGAAAFSPVSDASSSNTAEPSASTVIAGEPSSATAASARAPLPPAASADSSLDLSMGSEEGEADERTALLHNGHASKTRSRPVSGMGTQRSTASERQLGMLYAATPPEQDSDRSSSGQG